MKITKETTISKGSKTSTSHHTVIPKVFFEWSIIKPTDKLLWTYEHKNDESNEIIITIKNSDDKTTKNTSSNIDVTTEKQEKKDTKTETTSSETSNTSESEILDPNLFERVTSNNGQFRINVTSPKNPKLTVKGGTKEHGIRVTYRSYDEVKKIIEELQECNSEDEIEETLNKYRK